MLDIPNELLLIISTYLEPHDLRALATSSHCLCYSLLPEYLHRRGLVLKGSLGSARGTAVELRDLGGYASLGLWSAVRIFHPPKDVYCSIPHEAQEARSAMRFLLRFLQDPLNVCNLQTFSIFLPSDPYLVTLGLCQIQDLFRVLPLRELSISGFCSEDFLSRPIALRSGLSSGSSTLTSFTISSDHAFTPLLVQTTMGILKNSPIKNLEISMVSLNSPQWSTLLGELNMAFLENVDLDGDIPRPSLIRFLTKHRGLKRVCIRGNVASGRALPGRSLHQHHFPNLLTLRAPLAVCCDIVERVGDTSNLFRVEVEVSQLHPFDPPFLRLVEILRRFPKVDGLGFQVRPSLQPIMPQESSNDYSWDKHPACGLKQIRTLGFVHARGGLSPGDIVCSHLIYPISFNLFN